jgi:hypothetical protein
MRLDSRSGSYSAVNPYVVMAFPLLYYRLILTLAQVDQVIVEVRKEIPEDVINSKLGAYKWVDTIVDSSSIPPDYRDCETTILRARVRSHDAVEKIGGEF